MKFSQDIVDEVRLHNDIVSVIGEYVKLEKKGSNYLGLCPFHKEKTPSFSVSPTKQFFYCFGCQKGGNVVNFVSMAEGLDFWDSVKLLADRGGVDLPQNNNRSENERQLKKQSILEMNKVAARHYFSNLPNSKVAMEYLTNRGIKENVIKSFGIGYSEDSWNSLYNLLKEKGYEDDLMIESGLVLESKKGTLYDRFRNRIMFPIFDVMGKVIGFGGRVLDDSLPKYLNSPETPVYNKGRNLYALNFSRKNKSKQLIVVEGYMDVISLHQNGITNAVASLGTALTENQGRLLKKYCEEVIISYDADGAGQKATLRGLDVLSKLGCNVRVLQIPDGKDPDDFIRRNGAREFGKLVDNALTLVDYKAATLKKNIDTSKIEGKVEFFNKLSGILAGIDNLVERDLYVKRFAEQYGVSEESLNAEILKDERVHTNKQRVIRNDKAQQVKQREILSEDLEKISHDEKMIISLLCVDNDIYRKVRSVIDEEFFRISSNKEIAKKVFAVLDKDNSINVDGLFDILDDNDRDSYAQIIYKECNCQDNYKAIKDLIKRIELSRLDIRQKEILNLLKDTNLDVDERNKLSEELKSIITQKNA